MVAEADQVEEIPEYPDDKRLFRIADWTNILSWVILIFSIIWQLISLGWYLTENQLTVMDIFLASLSTLGYLLRAGFMFLLLQAISEIIYLLLDIRELAQLEPAADAG